MKIIRKSVFQMTSRIGEYVLVEEDSYEYDGPIARVCFGGASSNEKSISQSQQQMLTTLQNNYQQQFAGQTAILNNLNTSASAIFNQGINQQGFSAPEQAAMRTQSEEGTAQAYKQAKAATGESLAALGGGNTFLPSGTTAGINANLANSAAQANASNQLGITEANYAQGRQNYMNAAGVLGDVARQENPLGYAGAQDTQGQSAFSSASQVTQQNNQASQELMSLAGSLGGAALGAFCPATGTLYLMADGTERPVETLSVGDQIMGIDGEPQAIEEIQSAKGDIVVTETENGYFARTSPTHAYALPIGGFTVATRSEGKTIVTAVGPSKVVSVKRLKAPDYVFNIITNGSHTYRADGLWSLGVGDAERHIGMNEWALIGSSLLQEAA